MCESDVHIVQVYERISVVQRKSNSMQQGVKGRSTIARYNVIWKLLPSSKVNYIWEQDDEVDQAFCQLQRQIFVSEFSCLVSKVYFNIFLYMYH